MANLDPVEGSEQAGTRPVVVVSRDALNQFTPICVVCPLTDAANKKKVFPSHVGLSAASTGLKLDSIVLTEQVRAISKTRLRRQVGSLDRRTMQQIEAALKVTLDLL
jgi:mRNA interferase MazF